MQKTKKHIISKEKYPSDLNLELLQAVKMLTKNRVEIFTYHFDSDTFRHLDGTSFKLVSETDFMECDFLYPQELEIYHNLTRNTERRWIETIFSLRVYNPKTNKHYYFKYELSPIKDGESTIGYVILRQDKVQEHNDLYEKEETVQSMHMAMSLTNTTRWRYNRKTDTIRMGYTDETHAEFSKEFVLQIQHPNYKNALFDLIDKTFETKTTQTTTTRMLNRTAKEYRDFQVTANIGGLEDEASDIVYGVLNDITVKLEQEKSLIKLNRQNELILNNSSSGILYLDTDENIQWTNLDQEIYKNLHEFAMYQYSECRLCVSEEKRCEYCPIEDCKKASNSIYKQFKYKGKIFDTWSTATYGDSGYEGIVIRVDDVTDRENMLFDLEIAKKKAEQSERLKMAFLANMSHEIRTPLNAIVGFSELLGETDEKDMKLRFVDIIKKNSDTLLHLIGDILDLSKLESGLVEVKFEEFDILNYIEDVHERWEPRFTEKGLTFQMINPHKHCIIKNDIKILEQILNNYLSNAYKYTTEGMVSIGYEESNDFLRIWVKDTGIGIPEEKQSYTFGRFAKLDEFAQGSGLGLSICKALAEKCNGKVGFESSEGVGSIFWVELPQMIITD